MRAKGAPRQIELELLGGFKLTVDGRAAAPAVPAQRFVALLAIKEATLRRGFVAGTLWPDATEQRALASLRSALWRLRRIDDGVVVSSRAGLRIGGQVSVDVHRTVATCDALINGDFRRLPAAIPDELSHDLLPDWYDDWVMPERERVRQLRLHALEALGYHLIAERRFAGAIEAGMVATRAEPLRESAHRLLVRAHLAEGNVSEALRQYRSYVQLVNEALGINPTRDFRDLVAPFVAGSHASARGPAAIEAVIPDPGSLSA